MGLEGSDDSTAVEIIELLVANGAKIKIRDNVGHCSADVEWYPEMTGVLSICRATVLRSTWL
jgi:hypothetical protein